jgi:GNAT superfamily N-acetyltransferase
VTSVPVRVRRASVDEILPLRHAVLRPGLPRDAARFDGDDAPDTVHVAAVDDDGAVVGCATLVHQPLDGAGTWRLRGMATRPDRVRQGIGAAVLRAIEASAPGTLWCDARVGAVPFYASQGWAVISDVYDVPGVGPHRRMRKAC